MQGLNLNHGQALDLLRVAADITIGSCQKGVASPAVETIPALFKAVYSVVQEAYLRSGEPVAK